ncbi:MAG TPA: hypothetical protein VMX36_11695 [Sedimentisphaerales bacterium]|nr:hypothetical protein [Sedimentisphaerales bacterium]
MKFLPVFTLRVTHSYYADGRCSDFSMEPNPATDKLLKNHRCVLKSFPDGIRVFMQVDDEGKPFIAYPEEITFTFHLRLHNPDFALFTDLSDIANRPAPLYTNAGLNPEGDKGLQLDSRKAWFTESFIVEHPAQENCFILSGHPLEGLTTDRFEIMDSGNVKLKEYDKTDKVITVDTQSALKDETFAVKYPIAPRLERGVFADVEIHNNGTLRPADRAPIEFQIAFTARQARWKYYLVTNLNGIEDVFQIVDKDELDKLVFSNKHRTNLVTNPDSSDDLAEELAQKYPGTQRFRFVSDNLISSRQTARKHLELHFDGNRLFEALPNPSLRNYSKIEVEIDANLHQQDAFSQVVKYITKPFP